MTDKIKMRALMALPATKGREPQRRGAEFSARDAQEARDLERMGQAERVRVEAGVNASAVKRDRKA